MAEKAKMNIHQRIHSVMSEISSVGKDSKMQFKGGYKYTSHDKVAESLHPYLVKAGIVVIPDLESHSEEGNRVVANHVFKFVNIDNPEDFVAVRQLGFGNDLTDHGPGKALSYAWKIAMLKTFALATGEDSDADALSNDSIRSGERISTISSKQVDELRAAAKHHKLPAKTAIGALCKALGRSIKAPSDVGVKEFEAAMKSLVEAGEKAQANG